MKNYINKPSKVITLIFTLIFAIPAFAQVDISSSELKTMQSRKFATSIDKVAEAFKTYCEDSSGNYRAMPSLGANGKPSDTQSGTCMMGVGGMKQAVPARSLNAVRTTSAPAPSKIT